MYFQRHCFNPRATPRLTSTCGSRWHAAGGAPPRPRTSPAASGEHARRHARKRQARALQLPPPTGGDEAVRSLPSRRARVTSVRSSPLPARRAGDAPRARVRRGTAAKLLV